jgi:uncharacterized RDD family membrane protein YckC/phage FluMu protein Com
LIEFSCRACEASLSTTDDRAGMTAKCPSCGELITVPAPPQAGSQASDALPGRDFADEADAQSTWHPPFSGSREQACPMCGASNPLATSHCSACGENLGSQQVSSAGDLREVVYAGFWLRFVALIVDGFLMLLILIPILLVVMFSISGGITEDQLEALENMDPLLEFMINLGSFFAMWPYYAFFESSSLQGTPGKRLLRLKVTDLEGRRISFLRASGRYFGRLPARMICYIGFLMAAFTDQKQGLHDKMSGCLVVRRG